MQNLLAKPGTELGAIRRVLSHPQGFEQCRRFLSQHNWEHVAVSDTAGAAERVSASTDPGDAAIANQTAAEHYGLAVVGRGHRRQPAQLHAVRGPISGTTTSSGTGNKSSIIFSVSDQPKKPLRRCSRSWKTISTWSSSNRAPSTRDPGSTCSMPTWKSTFSTSASAPSWRSFEEGEF
ncbi:MAG: hypothetical protein M0C28_05925 [Candidatus Moduliflexus flocculans]|nr:hypothetical protein [Candidatus Moduliflexus flocculans]